jgi:hypothetical protein
MERTASLQEKNHMTLLSREDLKVLTAQRPGWHVSMFMPMHRAGAETQQNPIRCKNLLRQAVERLLASGMRDPEAEQYLEPVQQFPERSKTQ